MILGTNTKMSHYPATWHCLSATCHTRDLIRGN